MLPPPPLAAGFESWLSGVEIIISGRAFACCPYAALAFAGRGPGEGVGPDARRAALRGLAEGLADAPTWWADRRADRARWTRGELATWRALWDGRARWRDVARGAGD